MKGDGRHVKGWRGRRGGGEEQVVGGQHES